MDACPGRIPHLHPGRNSIVICNLCKGDPACVKECVKGKWGALQLVSADSVASRRTLAKTPEELTRETALKILGEEVLKEALG